MKNKFHLDRDYNPNKISIFHEYIKNCYLDSFSQDGYSIEMEKSIVSGEVDPSVIFIGSTISALKPRYISGKMDAPGIVICQPCIRTHNLRNAYNEEPNNGNTFFNLVGGLSKGNCFREVYRTTLKFLSGILGNQLGRLYIRVASEDKDILRHLHEQDFPAVEIDSKPLSSHRWKYGISGVVGRGISIAMRGCTKKGYLTLGNIILMESDKYPLATQWGYGIESIISGHYEKSHVIHGSLVAQTIPCLEDRLKFIDFLSGTAEMFGAGLKPIKQGPGKFMRFYLKGLSHQIEKVVIGSEEVEKNVINYCKLRGREPEEFLKIIQNSNESHRKNVGRLRDDLSKGSIGDFHDVEKISNKYQLHPDEVRKIMDFNH